MARATSARRLLQRCAARMIGPSLCAACLAIAGCQADLGRQADTGADRLAESNRLVSMGVEAQHRNKLDDAIGYYRRALELNPNTPVAWNNMGTALMTQGHYLDAAAALKRAADVNPDPHDARPYENLGLVYYNAGFAEQSLQYYEMALERDANWLPALRGTALAARKLNKSNEHLAETMRRALMIETDPKWRDVFERERLRIEAQLREQNKPTGKL